MGVGGWWWGGGGGVVVVYSDAKYLRVSLIAVVVIDGSCCDCAAEDLFCVTLRTPELE